MMQASAWAVPQNPTQFVEPMPRFNVVRVRGVSPTCMWTVKAPLRRGFPLLWEARDYGATTWSPACHEQLSWRFHWWRHSHSVPVQWHREVARAALAVEQVERAAQPEPQATQAAREAVRAATALLNRPAAKAVRLAILLLNRPAVRAKIALIPQGRELGLVLRPGA